MKWIESIPSRQVAPTKNIDQMVGVFAEPLQEHPIEPSEVVDALARLAEPGLMAMSSGRFFGWVIGGTSTWCEGPDEGAFAGCSRVVVPHAWLVVILEHLSDEFAAGVYAGLFEHALEVLLHRLR